MTAQSTLAKLIGDELTPLGFRRRQFNSFRLTAGLYCICNVQKSTWGDGACYLNLGFSPPAHAVNGWLAQSHCWVRIRAEGLGSMPVEHLRLLDQDALDAMGAPAWGQAVVERVARPIARVMSKAVDVPSPAQLVRTEFSRSLFIHRDMYAMFGQDANTAEPHRT